MPPPDSAFRPDLLRYQRLIVLLLAVLAVLAVGFLFQQLKSVLLPLVLAGFLSYMLRPLYGWLRARRVPTVAAILIALLVVALVFFTLGLIVFASAEAFVEALPRYEARVQRMLSNAVDYFQSLGETWGVDVNSMFDPQNLELSSLTSALQSGVSSFVSFFSNILLILLYLLFILAGFGQMETKIRAALDEKQASRIVGMLENIDRQLRQYLITKTLISLASGAVTTIILLIFGVDFALLWGFITFLFNFIPNIGSMVATLLPVTVSVLQFDSFLIPVLVLVALLVSDTIMGNVVEPRMMASGLNLSPLLVLFALIFWGWMWGIWGMVLAVPLTSTIKIAFENIPALHPIAVMMSETIASPLEPVPVANLPVPPADAEDLPVS